MFLTSHVSSKLYPTNPRVEVIGTYDIADYPPRLWNQDFTHVLALLNMPDSLSPAHGSRLSVVGLLDVSDPEHPALTVESITIL